MASFALSPGVGLQSPFMKAGTAAINILTTRLQASTVWAKLDAFYVMVGTSRLSNLKNPGTFDLTLTGAVYNTDIGIYCDGVNDLIDTNFNPSTAGGQYTQNAASFGYWCWSGHPVSSGTPMGNFNTNGSTLNGRTSLNNNASFRINQAAAVASSGGPVANHVGLLSANRSASNACKMLYNGVQIATGTNASTALENSTFRLGTANGSTFATPGLCYGAAFIGGNLADSEHLEIYNALSAFWAMYANAAGDGWKPQAYSWWSEAVADYQDGRIIIGGSYGGNSINGTQSLMEIGEAGNVVSIKRMQDLYPLDDHHIVATKRLTSGKRVLFMTGHGLKEDSSTSDHTLAVAVSPTGRIADFGSISTVTNTMTKSNYGMINQMINGRVFVNLTVDGDKLCGVIYSDDDGSSWTVAKPHVTQASAPGGGQNQMYEKAVAPERETIRVFNIPHPSNTQNNIYVSQIDTRSGTFSSGSTSFGSIYQSFGAALTDVTNTSALTALASGRSQRLMDVKSDGTMFLVCEFDNPGGANASYFLYRMTGSSYASSGSWTKSSAIVAAGTPFWASSFYYGGAVFARESHTGIRIYTARESGGTKYIERKDSSDNGANWTTTELKSSATLLVRPVATGSSTLPVIWQRVTSYTQFDNWSGMTIEWS